MNEEIQRAETPERTPVPARHPYDPTWSPLIGHQAIMGQEDAGTLDMLIWSLTPMTFRKTADAALRGRWHRPLRKKIEKALHDWVHYHTNEPTYEEAFHLRFKDIDRLAIADRRGLLIAYVASACERRDVEIQCGVKQDRRAAMEYIRHRLRFGWFGQTG